MSSSYRKHYNSIYELWEVEQEQVSGITGMIMWQTLSCHETEAEADKEIKEISGPGNGEHATHAEVR